MIVASTSKVYLRRVEFEVGLRLGNDAEYAIPLTFEGHVQRRRAWNTLFGFAQLVFVFLSVSIHFQYSILDVTTFWMVELQWTSVYKQWSNFTLNNADSFPVSTPLDILKEPFPFRWPFQRLPLALLACSIENNFVTVFWELRPSWSRQHNNSTRHCLKYVRAKKTRVSSPITLDDISDIASSPR